MNEPRNRSSAPASAPASRIPRTLFRVLVVGLAVLLSPALAVNLPAVSIPLGLLLTAAAVLYVRSEKVRRQINAKLNLADRRPWLNSTGAVLVGFWSLICLVGFSSDEVRRNQENGDSHAQSVQAASAPPPRVITPQAPPAAPAQPESCPPGQTTWGRALDPDTGTERLYCGINYRVVGHEDDNSAPNNIQRGLLIVVDETATREELTELLEFIYVTTRDAVMRDPREFKEVYAHVFVSEKRAKAGNGEWIAMIAETGRGRLAERTAPIFQLPDPKAEKPTPQEDEIYDAFWDALNQDDSPDAEERIKREVARRFKKSIKEFDRIYIKVFAYRHGS